LKYNTNENPRVEVTSELMEAGLQISIKDNGIGIEDEHKSKIFEMFQRLHGKGVYEGTGIGLAICKKIMNRYNGDIWVTSVKDGGSTFHIMLPKELIYTKQEETKLELETA